MPTARKSGRFSESSKKAFLKNSAGSVADQATTSKKKPRNSVDAAPSLSEGLAFDHRTSSKLVKKVSSKRKPVMGDSIDKDRVGMLFSKNQHISNGQETPERERIRTLAGLVLDNKKAS